MKHMILLCSFLGAAFFCSKAQPNDWRPSPEYFSVTHDSFPDATAIIISDKGEVFANRGSLNFNYTTMIQVLKESGKSQGEIELFYDKADETIEFDFGFTFNLEADGTVSASPITREQIFRTELEDNYVRITCNLPNVRKGSIIRYGYTRSSTSSYSFLWEFQKEVPVIKSEMRFVSDKELGYSFMYMGAMLDKFNFDGQAVYSMENIPAIREEPLIPDVDAFTPKVRIQLTEYVDRSVGRVVQVFPDWKEFGNDLIARDEYKLSRGKQKALELQVERICNRGDSPEEKARKIYNFVQNEVEWSNRVGIFPDLKPTEVLEQGVGDAADINTLLFWMLKLAGLEPDLAFVGTRGRSMVVEQYTLTSQFNCLMVHLELDGTHYALDATDPYRPFDLPARFQLNRRYLVLKKNGTSWQDIPLNQVSKRKTFGILTLQEDGSVSGDLTFTLSGYDTTTARRILEEEGEYFFWQWRFPESVSPSVVQSAQFFGIYGPDSVLKVKAEIYLDEFATVTDERIFLNPILFDRLEKNPFSEEERMYPVDYPFPRQESYRVSVVLPENVELEELPQTGQLILPNREMSYTFVSEDMGMAINLLSEYDLTETYYQPASSDALRQLYDEIIKREGQQIVMKKAIE